MPAALGIKEGFFDADCGALIGPDSGRPVTLRAILAKSVLVENAMHGSRQ